MNDEFQTIINASAEDRRGLFSATAERLGTAPANIEKDFWVCWTIDALFNRVTSPPRKLFKGGTALSKAFGLIQRFSEDIDLTIFRADLGHDVAAADLLNLSKGQRNKKLEGIAAACRTHISDTLVPELQTIVNATMHAASISDKEFSVSLDPEDPDQQVVLFRYPAGHAATDYILATVKIESGARSAVDPHVDRIIRPFVEREAGRELSVPNVTSVTPDRTFWDKIIILHSLRRSYDVRNELKRDGERVSRHYFDVHSLLQSPEAEAWITNDELAGDCAQHAQLFFGSAAAMLQEAKHGSYALSPTADMAKLLATDYERMAGMVFGEAPAFSAVLESVQLLEERLNG